MQWLARLFVVLLIFNQAALYGQDSDYAALRLPRPQTPSVPGLEIKEPQLVPGLEEVRPAFGPSLTPDLKMMVYAGTGRGRDYDLFVTRRESVDKPFGPPEKIGNCSSGRYETFPTISPDGLELIFLRFDPQARLYSARRDSTNAEFGAAAPWSVSEALPDGRFPGGAQFIDPQHVQFVTRGEKTDQERVIMLTSRDAVGAAFGEPAVVVILPGPNPHHFSTDRLRAYYGAPGGLYFAGRKLETEIFGNRSKIADVPIEGPVWLSPKEDVVFFCSPGRGQAVGESNRRLWMMRL
jgi:hypothetical protein